MGADPTHSQLSISHSPFTIKITPTPSPHLKRKRGPRRFVTDVFLVTLDHVDEPDVPLPGFRQLELGHALAVRARLYGFDVAAGFIVTVIACVTGVDELVGDGLLTGWQ